MLAHKSRPFITDRHMPAHANTVVAHLQPVHQPLPYHFCCVRFVDAIPPALDVLYHGREICKGRPALRKTRLPLRSSSVPTCSSIRLGFRSPSSVSARPKDSVSAPLA